MQTAPIGGSVSVHAGIHPSPGVGLETPRPDPSIFPLECGSGDPPAARHAGIPPAMHAGIPPPPCVCTEFLTHATENITLPQTSFAGCNHISYFHTG